MRQKLIWCIQTGWFGNSQTISMHKTKCTGDVVHIKIQQYGWIILCTCWYKTKWVILVHVNNTLISRSQKQQRQTDKSVLWHPSWGNQRTDYVNFSILTFYELEGFAGQTKLITLYPEGWFETVLNHEFFLSLWMQMGKRDVIATVRVVVSLLRYVWVWCILVSQIFLHRGGEQCLVNTLAINTLVVKQMHHCFTSGHHFMQANLFWSIVHGALITPTTSCWSSLLAPLSLLPRPPHFLFFSLRSG